MTAEPDRMADEPHRGTEQRQPTLRPDDIAAQRAELAATLGELGDRLDVGQRAKDATERRLSELRRRRAPVAAVAAALATLAALIRWRRRN